MKLTEAIEHIQNNELDKLDVLCQELDSMNEIPSKVFIDKLQVIRDILKENAKIKVIEVNCTETKNFFTIIEEKVNQYRYLNKHLSFEVAIRGKMTRRKDEYAMNKEYFENEFFPINLFGKQEVNSKYEVKKLGFYNEIGRSFALSFKIEKATNQVSGLWICNNYAAKNKEFETYDFCKMTIFLDEYIDFKANEEYKVLEKKAAKNLVIQKKYIDKILHYNDLKDLFNELPFKNDFIDFETTYRLANEWEYFIRQIDYLMANLPLAKKCKLALYEFEFMDENPTMTIEIWQEKHKYLFDNILHFFHINVFDLYCIEHDDHFLLGNNHCIKFEKEELELMIKFKATACTLEWWHINF
jgi:hypothetical protein